MYTNAGGQLFGAGHESAGIPYLATQWFLAEGATGPFFHQFILVANPNGQDAQIDARYLLPDGSVVTRHYVASANSRLTIGVHAEGPELAATPRLDDGHVDQRRARPGRARDVVAGDRAGMVRGPQQRRRARQRREVGAGRRRERRAAQHRRPSS